MPDPVSWLVTMYRLVVAYDLHTAIETLAWTLVLALFAYGVLRLVYYSRGSELGVLFGRLLLAGAVLLMLPDVRGVAHDTWVSVYAWSSSVWGGANLDGLKERLFDATEIMREELGPFIATQAILEAGGEDMAFREAAAVSDAGNDGFGSVPLIANVILTVLTPILFALYAALIFISGLVVLLGVLLLPLSGALLMLPGGGASWLSQWLKMYLGSLFTVAFLPIAFGLIVTLGLIEPTESMAATIQEAMAQMEAMAGAIDSYPSEAGGSGGFWGPLKDWLSEQWNGLRVSFQATVTLLIGWLMSLIMMVVGFLIGILLLFKLERLVTGFLGGIAGGAGATVAGLALFSAFRGARMLRGVGASGGPPPPPPQGGRSAAGAVRTRALEPPSRLAPDTASASRSRS